MTSPICAASIGLLLAGALVSPALANSENLRPITVGAAACAPVGTAAERALASFSSGSWLLSSDGKVRLVCALPTSTGRISQYRISYRDPDGRSGNASVQALLWRAEVPTIGGPGVTAEVGCNFLSNQQGVATTTFTHKVVPCDAELRPGFHYFDVLLWRRAAVGDRAAYVAFVGIDFP